MLESGMSKHDLGFYISLGLVLTVAVAIGYCLVGTLIFIETGRLLPGFTN